MMNSNANYQLIINAKTPRAVEADEAFSTICFSGLNSFNKI